MGDLPIATSLEAAFQSQKRALQASGVALSFGSMRNEKRSKTFLWTVGSQIVFGDDDPS